MIVNTAYIYMGSGGGGGDTPVNPNLWQDGVSNYPVELTNSTISSAGLDFITQPGAATFSELTLTHFNSLTLSGKAGGPGITAEVKISISFYANDNVLLGTTTALIKKSGNSVIVNIPISAKIQNAKIKIEKETNGRPLTLSSALLS